MPCDTTIDAYTNFNTFEGIYDFHPSNYFASAKGQVFNVGSVGYDLCSVEFRMKKTGSPSGSLQVQLYAVTSCSGTLWYPVGDPLALSTKLDIAQLTWADSGAVTTFHFPEDQYSLQPNTLYAAVVVATDPGVLNSVDAIHVAVQSDGSHPQNRVDYYNGWHCYSYTDCWFVVYGEAEEPCTYDIDAFLEVETLGGGGQEIMTFHPSSSGFTSSVGQVFSTPSSEKFLCAASFRLRKFGNPSGNLQVQIFEIAGELPTGFALASSEKIDITSLTTSGDGVWYFFTFPEGERPTLLTNHQYAVVLIAVDPGYLGSLDTVRVGHAETNPSHPGWSVLFYSSAWHSVTAQDTCFIVYGESEIGEEFLRSLFETLNITDELLSPKFKILYEVRRPAWIKIVDQKG